MIFGRKKRPAEAEQNRSATEVVDERIAEEVEDRPAEAEARPEVTPIEAQAALWDAEFDRDWGPFDIEEVDLEADADEVQRLDLGTLVLTPFEGMSLQLQVNKDTNTVQSLLVGDGNQSALEVAVFAGPGKSSMVPEIRSEIIRATQQQKGRIELVEGPFGAEVRRSLPMTDPNGNPAMHVSRTWLVPGPGWVLRGVLLGKATFEPNNEDIQVALREFFSALVVRRGTAPAAPGSLLPMTVPQQAQQQAAQED
ncbi:DUF3710 domain-containing protein [Tessaracoccus sp. MC1865]|uniref:DUF3710 domain-containing protein n=1 Tax=Tessaracoccus sp. MC1865 TaxID=2760310 RepID=UPI0015FFD4F1|nr:DUF3710 domain-containing protein [Tessaracoccus sp. MC1865]MBB1483320.1 DUF3710 domain-containing protein [Tessaracoccus sp. MC1865]QTO36437.1 DUF3710 domain-containing protein [Tessaracoccus sp. MC1865]